MTRFRGADAYERVNAEASDVAAQLPPDLRELWVEAGAWSGRDIETRGGA